MLHHFLESFFVSTLLCRRNKLKHCAPTPGSGLIPIMVPQNCVNGVKAAIDDLELLIYKQHLEYDPYALFPRHSTLKLIISPIF